MQLLALQASRRKAEPRAPNGAGMQAHASNPRTFPQILEEFVVTASRATQSQSLTRLMHFFIERRQPIFVECLRSSAAIDSTRCSAVGFFCLFCASKASFKQSVCRKVVCPQFFLVELRKQLFRCDLRACLWRLLPTRLAATGRRSAAFSGG